LLVFFFTALVVVTVVGVLPLNVILLMSKNLLDMFVAGLCVLLYFVSSALVQQEFEFRELAEVLVDQVLYSFRHYFAHGFDEVEGWRLSKLSYFSSK